MSSPVTPDLSGLASLARHADLDLRQVVLRVQTDLFVTAPVRDAATIAAFEAMACGLLPVVDDATAAIVARKLAPLSDTPETVLLLLAARPGECCRAVVELAPSLSRAVLEAARASGQNLAPFLAARSDLDHGQVLSLLARDEEAVDLALAANAAVTLRGDVLDTLIARAQLRPDLAAALLSRETLSAADIAPLYLPADERRREHIRAGIHTVALLRTRYARGFDAFGCERLVEAAGCQDAEAFGARLAAMIGFAPAPEWRFEEPDRHDLLALALLAAGVAEEDAVRIFLTLHPVIARQVDVVFRLVELMRTSSRVAAAYLVEAIVGAAPAPRGGRHVPALHPSESPVRKPHAVPLPSIRAGASRRVRQA
jgi:hypothetical protein